MNYPDDRLRLIFTCCHPALGAAATGFLSQHGVSVLWA